MSSKCVLGHTRQSSSHVCANDNGFTFLYRIAIHYSRIGLYYNGTFQIISGSYKAAHPNKTQTISVVNYRYIFGRRNMNVIFE